MDVAPYVRAAIVVNGVDNDILPLAHLVVMARAANIGRALHLQARVANRADHRLETPWSSSMRETIAKPSLRQIHGQVLELQLPKPFPQATVGQGRDRDRRRQQDVRHQAQNQPIFCSHRFPPVAARRRARRARPRLHWRRHGISQGACELDRQALQPQTRSCRQGQRVQGRVCRRYEYPFPLTLLPGPGRAWRAILASSAQRQGPPGQVLPRAYQARLYSVGFDAPRDCKAGR